MIPAAEAPPTGAVPAPGSAGGTLLGKRYVNAAGALELLCVKAGRWFAGGGWRQLVLKEAKPLPSSD
ncbi:MAG: hypothetical protein IPM40_04275 [Gammaproteobacteria bacterium]|nr:hypothetical protein [Gammaproteobacteria bacterium]